MTNHCFISYSTVDALDFAIRLGDELKAGPPSIPVWLDKRNINPGRDWDGQLVEAIMVCDCLIFVMTPDSVEDESVCKNEWTRAITYKKPIIPILLDSTAITPFLLGNRQHIDFTGDYQTGLAKLRRHLEWLNSPAGELQKLKDRLADANRDLRRADDTAKQKWIQGEILQLKTQIAAQEQLIAHPEIVSQQVKEKIERGIEIERSPGKPITGILRSPFVNRPPMIAPAYFQNRFVETKLVGDFLKDDAKRLITVVGRGGVGKTAMVCRLLKALENAHLPNEGGPLQVDGILYLSEVSSKKIDFTNLYYGLSQLIPEKAATELEALFKDAKATTTEKTRALLNHFPGGRTVVLLDNFEDKIDGQTRNIEDAELKEALKTLLAAEHHGVKVIITTRVAPSDLGSLEPGRQQHIDLDNGLEHPYAENILREMDQDGKLRLKDASEELLAMARQRTMGFPRALEALVGILSNDLNTNLEEILADAKNVLPDQVVEKLVGEAFSRLDAHAQMVMQALAIYGRPVSGTAVDFLLQPYLMGIDSGPILGRLVNMHFVRKEGRLYYLHPVDRDYAVSRIPLSQASDQEPEAGGFNKTVLLQRGAAYFKETRLPRQDWKSMDDLAAPLAEFELRYEAGDFDDAARVLLEIDFNYLMVWGHNQVVAHMHERLKGKISEPSLKHSSIGNLGTVYYFFGAYQQAILCYEQALEIVRGLGDRQSEGIWLGSLGNCYGDVGELQRAIEKYEQALEIAHELGDRQGEGIWLGSLGNCYKDLGEVQRAIEKYEQALEIAREFGDRRNEGIWLGNLGGCYKELGEVQRAIENYEQGLNIAREFGDRRNEGNCLGSLGNCYGDLGELQRVIENYEKALEIARELGNRQGESIWLGNLGNCYGELGELQRAIDYCYQGLKIANEIDYPLMETAITVCLSQFDIDQGKHPDAIEKLKRAVSLADEITYMQLRNVARFNLSLAFLYANDLDNANEALREAQQYSYPPNNHHVWALQGLLAICEGNVDAAQEAFSTAITLIKTMLERNDFNYDALDAHGFALCGLALTERDNGYVQEAMESYRKARTLYQAKGYVSRTLRLFDKLAEQDKDGVLREVRNAVLGEQASG